jgi:hypothetical protein
MVIGVISGLLVLTKIEGFVVIVLLGLYSIWYSKVSRNKINWKLPATLFLSAVISVLVWLAYLALEFGNSFVQFNGWASDWAGQEVGGQSIPVSFSDYILRYHNISTFLGFLGRGLDRALLASVQWGYLTPIGFGLCCFGFLLLLKSDKATALPVVLLASLMYVPHFGMPLDQFEPRLFWPFLPIDYIMIAMASTSLYRALTQHRKILTKIGLVLNLKLSRSAKIRLLEPRFLAIIAFLLPFVIMAVHFAIYLLYFPPSNPNLPYQF